LSVPIFAPWSHDITLLTCVLVGVLVVWALQETLGWNFSGLVVPGYLASVFLVDPRAGGFILAEVALTTAIVQSVADRIPAWFPWSPLFGRDRFLVFLLVAAGVRVALEAGGASWALAQAGVDLGGRMHTIGLVIVPLAANSLWRLGWGHGLVRLTIQAAATWAILRGAVIPLTNLSLEGFLLAYEDLEQSFVSSSRATLLLLVGAWFGSRANARWGWDFGGIIVPGLLSLCWLEPIRLVATLGESVVLYGAMTLLLRTPLAARLNLTGDRPIVVLFGMAYALRWALGWILPEWADAGGFGFLLTAILAGAAVRRADVVRTVVGAVAVSGSAFVVAMGIGWGLHALDRGPAPEPEQPEVVLSALVAAPDPAEGEGAEPAVPVVSSRDPWSSTDEDVAWPSYAGPEEAARVAAVADAVLDPVTRWSLGEEVATDAAVAAARRLGGALGIQDDRAIYVEEGTRVVWRRGRAPRVVRVPFAFDEPWVIGRSATLRDAAWIAVVTTPPRVTERAYPRASVAHAVVEAAGRAGAEAVDVRGLRASLDPGADAVVSTGGAGRGEVPAWLAEWLASEGIGWAPYAGRADERALLDAALAPRVAALRDRLTARAAELAEAARRSQGRKVAWWRRLL
jgi:hypothetical protein